MFPGPSLGLGQEVGLIEDLDRFHIRKVRPSLPDVQSGGRSFFRRLDRREKDAFFGDFRARADGRPAQLALESRGHRSADVREQFVAGRRHHRGQQGADETETFGHVGQAGIEAGAIGGIGGLAPERRGDIARFGMRAVLGGSIATFMTATIAGVLSQFS